MIMHRRRPLTQYAKSEDFQFCRLIVGPIHPTGTDETIGRLLMSFVIRVCFGLRHRPLRDTGPAWCRVLFDGGCIV